MAVLAWSSTAVEEPASSSTTASAVDPSDPFSASPEGFEEQVVFQANQSHVISLEPVVGCIRDRSREIPANAVVITLDKGFRDNYVYANLILKDYTVPATIFVIVEREVSRNALRSVLGHQEPGLYLNHRIRS